MKRSTDFVFALVIAGRYVGTYQTSHVDLARRWLVEQVADRSVHVQPRNPASSSMLDEVRHETPNAKTKGGTV